MDIEILILMLVSFLLVGCITGIVLIELWEYFSDK
jgi:hypothetical protein